jgi:hypothetical protein
MLNEHLKTVILLGLNSRKFERQLLRHFFPVNTDEYSQLVAQIVSVQEPVSVAAGSTPPSVDPGNPLEVISYNPGFLSSNL